MINKKNKLIVGVLAFMLVLSVGYALFSESITINGTASTTGDFGIGVTCQAGLADVPGLDFFATEAEMLSGPTQENSFSESKCIVQDDVINFSTNLSAPGAMRYFTVKATNTGNIPAVAPIASNSTTTQACMGEDMIAASGVGSAYVCRPQMFNISDGRESNKSSIKFEDLSFAYVIEKKDGTIVNLFEIDEEEAMSYLADEGEKVRLESGDSIYYVGKMYIPEDYNWNPGGYEINMIDFNLSVNYSLNFIQQTNE